MIGRAIALRRQPTHNDELCRHHRLRKRRFCIISHFLNQHLAPSEQTRIVYMKRQILSDGIWLRPCDMHAGGSRVRRTTTEENVKTAVLPTRRPANLHAV